jgi:hypothetical protein
LRQLICAVLVAWLALSAVAVISPAGRSQAIYQVVLRAVDGGGLPVEHPMRFSISGYGNVTAYVHGTLTVSLTGGPHRVVVSLFNVQVGEAEPNIVSDTELEIRCRIYELKLSVRGLPANLSDIEGFAYAYVGPDARVNASYSKNQAIFRQLPAGDVGFIVFAGGLPIAASTFHLAGNDEAVLDYSVFRHVEVVVVDVNGEPLAGAAVTIGVLGNVTDSAGIATLYAPPRSSRGIVVFRGVQVFQSTVSVSDQPNIRVKAAVDDLHVLVVNEAGAALTNTPILVQLNDWETTVITDEAGRLSVHQLPFGNLRLSTRNGTPISVTFPLPSGTGSIRLLSGPLQVDAEVLDAYMLGYMTVKVTVRIGDFTVKNATVRADGQRATATAGGVALLRVPVGLEWTPRVNVTATAYGMTVSRVAAANASPLILATFPFAFTPLIIWRILVARYRRRRVPLA